MSEFIERIRVRLLEEKGIELEEVNYMEISEERERYNTTNVRGGIKTKRDAEVVINKFLNRPIPIP